MLEIRKINGEVVIKGEREDVVEFIENNFPHYSVGIKTPLNKLSYVIQPHYKLFNRGKEVYS